MTALDDIAAERRRQIEVESFTPEGDDGYRRGELSMAAAAYGVSDKIHSPGRIPYFALLWPWPDKWWKPGDRRHDLVRAGALIVAEIERLDRLGEANTRRQPLNQGDDCNG